MKKFLRFLKRTLMVVLILVVVLVISTLIFVKTAPQIGQPPKGEDLARIERSENYKDGKFVNLIETAMGSFGEMMSTLPKMFGKGLSPNDTIPVRFGENTAPAQDTATLVTWYGHSAFLIETEGKRILIDPMLTDVASPVPFGSKRWPYEEAIPLEDLTDIDIVILSHDHYDHLDHKTILQLKDHVDHFYTALGVGSHLKRWGVEANRITELDWWESADANGITLTACPARHFSGRGLFDRNSTQWASWVLKGKNTNIYFSGDGGYGPHFKEIGEKFGPFDLAFMECGQYNEAWSQIHMMPEESVQAGLDVKADLIMPIHWGAFTLAVHEWNDPILRFKSTAEKLDIPIIHPFIGERFELGKDFPREDWWVLGQSR